MLSLALLAYLATASAYIWPSPQLDELESQRFDQSGNNARGIAFFIQPCDEFDPPGDGPTNSGRSDAADWIRTSYHDMATHNVTDGTGGLDASIRFPEEQARAENVGDGFANTVGVLLSQLAKSNHYVSIADALALGTIIAIENCGGPEIAFRGGRVDALEPNTPGVPQPQEPLDTHIAKFARQGFTQTEMISLIACGHTFGGVQHAPFPEIVPELNDPNNTLSVSHFDSTFVHFDNNIATEYISGTTRNPLIVGLNDTTNSDKRIFGSDGNVTMRSFANSPELFASTCGTLFARMLNSVPKDVQLTDVITPLPVKPSGLQLVLDGDTLKLSGQVRFWNMTADADRTVRLLWDDRAGGTGNATLPFAGLSSAVAGRYSAAWYAFNGTDNFIPLNATAGIKTMRFTVNDQLEDQGGVGFAVQDGVVFSETSCMTSQNPIAARFDVAVRNGVNPTRVYIAGSTFATGVELPPITETDFSPPAQPVAANAAYSMWSLNFNGTAPTFLNLLAEVDGATTLTELNTFALPPCAG
ncbi:heme peroxidase [Mycena rosella]|uniref:Peroxidase n=1 Tax=Mycena rosella TaxID=1033263 RepID=A0AAD7GZA8_MYCRO|nr:heme peroxidase [Mycena rosella]